MFHEVFRWLSNQAEAGLEQLTQGLAGLDISQTSAHTPVTSTPVGGARPKVRPGPDKLSSESGVKAESEGVTAELNQSAERIQVSRMTAVSHQGAHAVLQASISSLFSSQTSCFHFPASCSASSGRCCRGNLRASRC